MAGVSFAGVSDFVYTRAGIDVTGVSAAGEVSQQGVGVLAPPLGTTNSMLLEIGDDILLEIGDKILLES